MKNNRAFLIVVIFFTGCGTLITSNQYPNEKIGTWCESDDGGASCYAYTTYLKNGSCSSHGEFIELNLGYKAECRWWHEGNKSCIEPTYEYSYNLETNKEVEYEGTDKFCNIVISMNERSFTYLNDEGTEITMYKVTRNSDKLIQQQKTNIKP